MNLRIIISLIALIGASVSLAYGDEGKAYSKAMSLNIGYEAKSSGMITVTLTNISDATLDLYLNTEEVEGGFLIDATKDKEESFYDKDYLLKVLTSQWISGFCKLKSKDVVEWRVPLNELVYFGDDRPVTAKSLLGESFSLTLEQLQVFPADKAPTVKVELRSNTITIPKIEQDVVE